MSRRREVGQQYPGDFHTPESSLANYLIGLEEEDRGDGDPEGLGGLEVDDQLVLHGLLDRQVGRRGPLQNLADQHGDALRYDSLVRPIGEQEARFRQTPLYPYRRQPVLERKVSNLSLRLGHNGTCGVERIDRRGVRLDRGEDSRREFLRLSYLEVAECET